MKKNLYKTILDNLMSNDFQLEKNHENILYILKLKEDVQSKIALIESLNIEIKKKDSNTFIFYNSIFDYNIWLTSNDYNIYFTKKFDEFTLEVMDKMITIYFEDNIWFQCYELNDSGKNSAFGLEDGYSHIDSEVFYFFIHNYNFLDKESLYDFIKLNFDYDLKNNKTYNFIKDSLFQSLKYFESLPKIEKNINLMKSKV